MVSQQFSGPKNEVKDKGHWDTKSTPLIMKGERQYTSKS